EWSTRRAQRAAVPAVVVARRVDHSLFRGGEMLRYVGEHRRRRESLLEGDSVGERLERRSRLAQRGHAVDGAAESVAEVIAGAFVGQPLAGAVVEDGDGDAVRAVLEEIGALGGDDALDLAL